MTAVAADFHDTDWPDIYVACDSTPSLLFRNNKDGTFTEVGLASGAALSEDGMEQAGMGVGVGDINLDGHLDIFKTHFAEDTAILYKNDRSRVSFKSYESGRKAFEGTAQHVIWLDEEGPLDIYTECLYRTATTDGVIYTTFTPLGGMSDVVKSFVEPESEEARAVKHVTQCDWSQVPDLDAAAKAQLLASTPIYQRDARTKGIPQLGAGAIYPLAESEILVPHFNIPAHWPRSYGLDVGWNRTAVVWGALDRENGVAYLYHEY